MIDSSLWIVISLAGASVDLFQKREVERMEQVQLNRNAYTRRIFEIVANIRKQQEDIDKVQFYIHFPLLFFFFSCKKVTLGWSSAYVGLDIPRPWWQMSLPFFCDRGMSKGTEDW